MKKILFITHDTSRTGAPKILMYLLDWLSEHHPEYECFVLSFKKGPLKNEFQEKCKKYYELNKKTKQKKTFINRLKQHLLYNDFKNGNIINELQKEEFDLVYANTIATIEFASKIVKSKNSKLLVHVHELNAIIKDNLPNFTSNISQVDHFIAASELVKLNLIQNQGVPETKITRIYECSHVDLSNLKINSIKKFTVGGSGTVHWRKGSDIFIQVARYVNTHYPDTSIEYCWVGSMSNIERIIIEEDLRKLNLKNVNFVGEVANPFDYYKEFDVFLMPSREDPFPLVCIEVGQIGIPIICFDGATGTQEILIKGGGFIVPYLDIESMAKKVINYYDSQALRKEHGQINKVEFAKFTPDKICPELFSTIESVLS